MGAGIISFAEQTGDLRASLRSATASAHDLLDRSMRSASGWSSLADYSRFLTLQYTARKPVEAWLSRHASAEFLPPEQCHLIAGDLEASGNTVPGDTASFTLPAPDSQGRAALGVAWVLAGSSLGNRAILKEVVRISAQGQAAAWPHAFLADEAMLSFWNHLRPQIERPSDRAEVEIASLAAAAVFDHFITTTQTQAVNA